MVAFGAALGMACLTADRAAAQVPPVIGEGPAGAQDLYLEVIINGHNTGRIATFRQSEDGALKATPEALRDAGLRSPGNAGEANAFIPLASLPELTFEYDEARQTITIAAPDSALDPHVLAVRAREASSGSPVATSWGAFANYSLVSAFDSKHFERVDFEGLVGSLDAHFSTPLGVLDSSAMVRVDPEFGVDIKRLDTTWTTYDVDRMMTYRAGDGISGGLAWTRPVRFGGLQIQRDFSVRPDLITRPLPAFQGSAAVPTTVEVYTNNVRTFSGEVEPGPFVIDGIPAGTGASTTTVVLRDFLGRETIVELPFFGSQRLLAEGLYDFSIEAGFPRRSVGTDSFDYDGIPFGSLTLRYGVSDSFSAETHFEMSEKHVSGGVGGAFLLGSWGTATVALAGSEASGKTGGLASASLEADIAGVTAFARTQRTFGDFNDIASISARAVSAVGEMQDFGPPRALDQLGLSFELPFDPTRLALSYSRRESADGDKLQIASLSLSRPFGDGAYFHLSGSALLDHGMDYAVFASVTFPLGTDHRAATGFTENDGESNTFAEIARPVRRQPGDVGWLLGTAQGTDESRLYGNATYHAPAARLRGTFDLDEDGIRATAEADGAIVVAGGGIFLSPHIYDAFAIVDAGVPDVEVFHENRLVGRTDSGGRIVVPNIRSFQRNRISIDPSELPLDASVPSMREFATAQPRSGIVVDFNIETDTASALVSFLDGGGNPVEVGSGGVRVGNGETFVVGYDGEAYLEHLDPQNRVTITKPDRSVCTAEFAFDATAAPPVRINSVPCLQR